MKHLVKKKWDEKTRLEVVQAYILTGSLALAAGMCQVPLPTAKVWKTSQWFKDLELELRQGAKLRLSSRLSKIVDKSIDALEDRIDKGDFFFNKTTKQFERKPITAEVAQKITAQLVDRVLLVEKAAQTGVVTDEGLDARLEKLRQEMKEFAKRPSLKPSESEIIDVTPILLQEPTVEVPQERPVADGFPVRTRPTPASAERDPTTLPADSSLRVVLG